MDPDESGTSTIALHHVPYGTITAEGTEGILVQRLLLMSDFDSFSWQTEGNFKGVRLPLALHL
jgi:hypothetical protein